MKFRRLLKICIPLLLIFVVAIGIISFQHPIILKWLSGTARHVGDQQCYHIYKGENSNRCKDFLLICITF